MILSNQDIKKAIKRREIRIIPLEQEQIGGASVDLTLSGEWYVFKKHFVGKRVDLSEVIFTEALNKVISSSITLKPGEMCLGKTVEKITLSSRIMGSLEGRSRFARMGLCVHVTSSLVQPGSDNHQILEIVNFAPFSITIHKGMRISQVVFERLATSTTLPYRKFGEIAKEQ